MRSCLEREGEKICRTSHCFAQNVGRWRLVSRGFPASVPSRRPICPSKALQCTPSGYPDQWSRAGETSAFAEKPHFNYLKFKINFLKKLCHGMWLFHLHSTLKLQLFYPIFPLAESTAKTFCWLSLWNFKEKSIYRFLWHSLIIIKGVPPPQWNIIPRCWVPLQKVH